MFDWSQLLRVDDLERLMPGEYARFARPVRAGLLQFLNGLAPPDQADILQRQAALPASASLAVRLAHLARCCPVLQKLAQVLARDPRLSCELRHQLEELESLPPTVSLEEIELLLQRELGPGEQRRLRIQPPALAEASVAVVVPYVVEGHATHGAPSHGVLKLLKPGIEERLERELALLEQVGTHLDEECESLGLPALDYQEAFQQIRSKLKHEICLDHEQRHLRRAADCYADDPRIQIPAVHEPCTRRLTAMQRLDGVKVTEWHRHHSERSDAARYGAELANRIVQALISHPIFSRASPALFHGDPHAGNLLLTRDRRLGILDWSLAGELDDFEREAIVQVLLGAVERDPARIALVLEPLSQRQPVDREALGGAVRGSLERLGPGEMPGFEWLTGLLDNLVHVSRFRFAPDWLLFRKALHTLTGVVAEIGQIPGRIDQVLQLDFLRHFLTEWPRRWIASGASRDFATRLSNLDLARAWTHAWWRMPSLAAGFWLGACRGLLDAGAKINRLPV